MEGDTYAVPEGRRPEVVSEWKANAKEPEWMSVSPSRSTRSSPLGCSEGSEEDRETGDERHRTEGEERRG